MISQHTLKNAVRMTGVGLHSGSPVQVTLKPGRPGTGIRFVRTDLENIVPIAADFRNVVNTQLATSLGRGKISVSTVEHLMSALQGAGIDNAIIEVNGPEVPIMDGSALPFYAAILDAGSVRQSAARTTLALRKKVELKIGEKWAFAEPSSRFEVHGSIDWDHPAIGYQEYHYISGVTPFADLASARTFGFLRDVEALKKMGLARGGSLENAVVLDDVGVLNPSGLRHSDEFVRHKVLDALGDFKLAGVELQGYFRLHRAGHDLHSQLLGAILEDSDNYEMIEQDSRDRRPVRTALAASFAASIT